jgi:hypothetical protein
MTFRGYALSVAIIVSLLLNSGGVLAADNAAGKIPPARECAEGWIMDGKIILYNKDNLFDRINGEAELYFPYGFEVLESARYISKCCPQVSIDADVYMMGSLLDAYGMYANYRRLDDMPVIAGAEGTVSAAQMLFYQDRYFIRIQAGGTLELDREVFLSCARSIARNIAVNPGPPKELEFFALPGVAKKSERYIAKSLLGYEFFRRGIIADATLEEKQVQFFLVFEDSAAAARRAFDEYRAYLKISEKEIRISDKSDYISITANDPLYGGVVVAQSGSYLFGIIRLSNAESAKPILLQMRKKLGS